MRAAKVAGVNAQIDLRSASSKFLNSSDLFITWMIVIKNDNFNRRYGARGCVHPVRGVRLHRRPAWGKGGAAPAGQGTASMLLVTGGAGFIGSNVVASLAEAGGD